MIMSLIPLVSKAVLPFALPISSGMQSGLIQKRDNLLQAKPILIHCQVGSFVSINSAHCEDSMQYAGRFFTRATLQHIISSSLTIISLAANHQLLAKQCQSIGAAQTHSDYLAARLLPINYCLIVHCSA